ncbi:MAG: PEP-CTERM sorting domain-containing protein [Pseudomonadota bacterium]
MKLTLKVVLATVLLSLVSQVHAVWYQIVSVETSNQVFGASLFHTATASNVMSGKNVGRLTGPSNGTPYGFYDDDSGLFMGTFDLGAPSASVLSNLGLPSGFDGGPTVGMFGTLSFGANGLMNAVSSLNTVFSGNNLAQWVNADADSGNDITIADNQLFFKTGIQCCNSDGFGPNSFKQDTNGDMVMTLWGANGWDVAAANYTAGGNPTTLGVDLRLRLQKIPEPATLSLLGLSLLAGTLMRRRMP